MRMKIILLEDIDDVLNDFKYAKGDVLEAIESKMFPSMYMIYVEDTIDWIFKDKAKIFEE